MIRPYEGKDFAEIIKIWNKALPEHPQDRRSFVKNVLLDMNFEKEGFLVAQEDGEILGFIWAIVRKYPVDVGAPSSEEKGYLNVLALKYEKDINGGVGRELILAAENYILKDGKKTITVSGYTPNYFYPGINAEYSEYLKLYYSLGYKELKRNFSISADLSAFGKNEVIEALKKEREAEGYIFAELSEEYIPSLLGSTLPGWRHRHRRLLNETLDFGKFRLVIKDGEVIGSAIFGDPYSNEERFGPYGVSAEYRGLGLGKILLYDTLTAMKSRGLKRAWAQSTPSSGAAFAIYEKFGFKRCSEYITLSKS